VGDYNLALEKLTQHLKKNPNDPEAQIFLSNLQITIGKSKSYTIAVSVPVSSDLDGSLEILRGVAQAQAEVNDAGGINKVPLRVAIANDSSEDANSGTKIAEQVAETLSKNQDILGIVGHYASDSSLATANIYKNYNLVSISPVSTSVKLTGYSPYFFRTVPNDKVAAQALAKYVSEKLPSKTTAVFYNSQSNYSKSLKQEFINALGDKNIVLVNDPDYDFSTWGNTQSEWNTKANEVLGKANEKNAKVIMLAANTSTLDKALEVIVVNKKKLSVLGGDDIYAPKTLAKGDNVVGLIVSVAWDIDVKTKSPSDFPSRSKEFWKNDSEVNWRTVTTYDATQALIKAIEMQPSPSRKGVKEMLSSPNFSTPGASEKVSFDSNGDYIGDAQLVEIQPDPKYPSGYDFKPITK
jgi:branched-chain amino acid transport system substrate-binding protein